MTATILAIIGVVIAAGTLFLMARQQAKETKRQQLEDRGRAVADAIAPYQQAIRDREQTIRDRDRRIEHLEDELRRSKG